MARFAFSLLLLIALLVTTNPPQCYGQFEELNEQFQKSNQLLRKGNRLGSVNVLRSIAKKQPAMASMLYQSLPLVSDYSIEFPYRQTTPKDVNDKKLWDSIQDPNQLERFQAIEKIVELARDRRIVILNEAHDSPQHRAFGHQLALALKAEGFTHAGIETLSRPFGSGIVKFKYPTSFTGHYSAAPVFGDFLRQASIAGYKMVAYEIEPGQQKTPPGDVTASIIERENAQSDNLIKHVLDPDPKSRLFLYVGYSHATENWEKAEGGQDLGWLAAQLQKKTGIDPLTIDQVGGSYNPKSNSIDPVFKKLNDANPFQQPTILQHRKSSRFITSQDYSQKVDLTVFHPVQKMQDGRPNWLQMNGYRIPHTVENQKLYQNQPTLVQAFHTNEGKTAIPVDQVLLTSAEGQSVLLLPTGKYRIVTSTADENTQTDMVIEINNTRSNKNDHPTNPSNNQLSKLEKVAT